MTNKNLFSTQKAVSSLKPADAFNEAGGQAYSLPAKNALAQFAVTGCFNGTYYSSDKEQLDKVLELTSSVDPEFISKLAVYAREKGAMKDMPAVLAAIVANKDPSLLSKIFPRVINNPKMLRNFVQIVRSGAVGRKSLGSRPKKLIQNYLNSLTDQQLFFADVGNSPSLQDIIKMVHPKPLTKERNALYAYLLDKEYSKDDILPIVNEFESFKKSLDGNIPNVPFQMLTSLKLTNEHWQKIAENATFTQIRMSINSFYKHGVFNNEALTKKLAARLSNRDEILKSKVFPYQLYTSYLNISPDVPVEITNALQDAAEIALDNVPSFDCKVFVLLDTSGSMSSPISGYRKSVTSKSRCIDAAALFASAILKKNPGAEIIPFDTQVHRTKLNPRDSIMTNTKILADFGGGGTDCAAPLNYLNTESKKGDVVIFISDNESWWHPEDYRMSRETKTVLEWNSFKDNNKHAKLVNIDIQPYSTTQVTDDQDVLNIGGFSDSCFEVIESFVKSENSDLWINEINKISL